jgi:hypothetical protein
MATPKIELGLIQAHLKQLLDGQAEVQQRLAAIEAKFEQHTNENVVMTGLIMRYVGEPVAWGGVQKQLQRLQEQIDALRKERP